jgi:hypothetical protein
MWCSLQLASIDSLAAGASLFSGGLEPSTCWVLRVQVFTMFSSQVHYVLYVRFTLVFSVGEREKL